MPVILPIEPKRRSFNLINMSLHDEALDVIHLRQLAVKCRRLATETYDPVTANAFRRMATEYDRLAHQKERSITIVQFPQPMV